MTLVAHSAGHNYHIVGASGNGYREEVENRKVLKSVENLGQVKYVNCTEDNAKTKASIWQGSARKHLNVPGTTYDVQYHFNASGTGGNGTEVWITPHGNRAKAERLGKAVASALGIKWRGVKVGTSLGWPNMTKTGMIVEICFIDHAGDMQAYAKNYSKLVAAIASVYAGKEVDTSIEHRPGNVVQPTAETYTIQAGDTFWRIATAYHVSVDKLKQLNPSVVPERLQIGQKINVPGTPKPAVSNEDTSLAGRRVESIWANKNDPLVFRNKPTWNRSDIVGTFGYGQGWTIVSKVRVDNDVQYKVKNSKGVVYYITASPKFVRVK